MSDAASGDSSRPLLTILLSTYQGERYLAEQLDSLLAQSGVKIRVLARDDGSTDGSAALLRHYQQRYPDSFWLAEQNPGNLGVRQSFQYLAETALRDARLEHCRYFAFCDQDDVWLPEKSARLLEAMHRLELRHGREAGLLVHCDLTVTDHQLNPVAPSFTAYQGLNPEKNRFRQLLVANTVTGCASLVNRPLLVKARIFDADSMMHDWWLALAAAAFGRIGYVDQPLVLYRQHGRNTVGAKAFERISRVRRLLGLLLHIVGLIQPDPRQLADYQGVLADLSCQARAFERIYGTELSRWQRFWLRRVAVLDSNAHWRQRLWVRLLRA